MCYAVTVTVQLALSLPERAVMTATPTLTPVTRPLALTVAMAESLDASVAGGADGFETNTDAVAPTVTLRLVGAVEIAMMLFSREM